MRTRHWLAVATLLTLGTLLALGGFAYTFIFPKVYEATTRIKVDQDVTQRYSAWVSTQGHGFGFWITTEFERLHSKWILHPVISDLALDQRWAEQRRQATPLPLDVTYALLRERITASQLRNTDLITITVWSNDPNEPALIANKIVDVYRDRRNTERAQTATLFLNALQEKQATYDKELQQLSEESTAAPAHTAKRDATQRRRAELQELIDFETAESVLDKSSVVLIDRAAPSSRPVRPNVFLGTGVLMLGGVIDLAVLLWVMMGRSEDRD